MFREGNFEKYGEALSQSLFADKIELELARAKRLGMITDSGRSNLQTGLDFFNRLVEFTNPDLSSRVEPFDLNLIVDAAQKHFPTHDDFIHFAEELRGGIQSVINGHPNEKVVQEVEKFFERYGSLQFRLAQSLIS